MCCTRIFHANKHGHADAVAAALEFLSSEILPGATGLDHELHEQSQKPTHGYDRNKYAPIKSVGV